MNSKTQSLANQPKLAGHTDFGGDKLSDVLKIFILSGSANGIEDNRRKCLKLVPLFSAAPALLEAAKAAETQLKFLVNSDNYAEPTFNPEAFAEIALKALRAAITLATAKDL